MPIITATIIIKESKVPIITTTIFIMMRYLAFKVLKYYSNIN